MKVKQHSFSKLYHSILFDWAEDFLLLLVFLQLIHVKFLGLMFGAVVHSLGPKWWEPFQMTFQGFCKLVRFLPRSQIRHSQSPQSWNLHCCRTGAGCGGGRAPSAHASWGSPAVGSFGTYIFFAFNLPVQGSWWGGEVGWNCFSVPYSHYPH